ncbi:FAD-dependent oxidoreductase [Oceaniglobus indicus]|uniref:FAD-dependent oxidoreductase n=1 Tax=Oceaniglobus indicus TaxID=2047749 RepID=UPI000C1A7FE8|nr:FAD-dependent oxidoreductase [Oceaniglobus indicus]
MISGRRITVIGGGIAGLSVALAAAQRGARVRVLERAPRLDGDIGAGLQISPNGVAVLTALGLADELRRIGIANQAVVLRDGATGRRVAAMDLSDRAYFLVHRGDLVDMLAKATLAAGVDIQVGQAVETLRETSGGVSLGGSGAAPLAIGADGLHSVVRGVLNGARAPAFTGQTAFRALVRATGKPPARAEVFMGPGRHLVRYPLRDGALINLVGVVEQAEWQAEGWSHPADPDAFRAAFAGFCPGVRDTLSRVETGFLWGLFRHPVAATWHSRRLALLGDAAHPTLPFLAQGANLALEDAWVLADCLDRFAQPEGLARYQALRRPRVIRAIAAANANARNYHLSNPLVRGIAHAGLRGIGKVAPGAMLRKFDWLYQHDVTAGPGR